MSGVYLSPAETDNRKINNVVRSLLEGRSNAVVSATLSSNSSTTTISAINCGPYSAPIPVPLTANAAAALSGLHFSSVAAGSFVANHASNSQTDRTFYFVCIG